MPASHSSFFFINSNVGQDVYDHCFRLDKVASAIHLSAWFSLNIRRIYHFDSSLLGRMVDQAMYASAGQLSPAERPRTAASAQIAVFLSAARHAVPATVPARSFGNLLTELSFSDIATFFERFLALWRSLHSLFLESLGAYLLLNCRAYGNKSHRRCELFRRHSLQRLESDEAGTELLVVRQYDESIHIAVLLSCLLYNGIRTHAPPNACVRNPDR